MAPGTNTTGWTQWTALKQVVVGLTVTLGLIPHLGLAQSAEDVIRPYDTPPKPWGGHTAIQKAVIYHPAAEIGHQGQVLVLCTINTHGQVTDMVILEGDPLLNDAALAALQSSQWHPAHYQDRPVTATAVVPVVFRLSMGHPSYSGPPLRPQSHQTLAILAVTLALGLIYLIMGN